MSLLHLNEVCMSQLTELKENIVDRKGVLKSVKGIFSEANEQNRNGRRYSRKLWDKVLSGDYVKEMLNNRTLFGEADHPPDRAEISLPNVSHVITSLKMMPDGVIEGTADILDTPAGRILNTLIEYGAVLGISSRGMGTVSENGGGQWVDEDSYVFITFDFVPMPSVKRARPGLKEAPELDFVPMSESIIAQIQNAPFSELPIIESVVSQLDENIKNRVQHILNERKVIPTSDNTLQEELQHFRSQNEDLRSTVERLKQEKQYFTETTSVFQKKLEEQEFQYKREVGDFQKTFHRLKSKISYLESQVQEAEKAKQEFKESQKRVQKLAEKANVSTLEYDQIKKEHKTLLEAYEKESASLLESNKIISSLRETAERFTGRNLELAELIYEVLSIYHRIPSRVVKESLQPGFTLADIQLLLRSYYVPATKVKMPNIDESYKSVAVTASIEKVNEESDEAYKRLMRLLEKQRRGL